MPSRIITWLTTLLMPFALIMLGVRLLMTPLFPEIEYRMPGFPADPYGFTLEDRLRWAKPSIEYLLNDADLSYLAELRFEDGTPIYNERELSHMLDVKNVVQRLLQIWYIHLVLLALLALGSWRLGQMPAFRSGLRWGGLLTVGLLLALGAFAAVSFWQFFAWFHSLFFEGDTWIFRFEDTLIRLFPLRFWQDTVLYIVGFAILAGLALGWGFRKR
ncbi:MAG: TIGR01906 family membrane protein [Anaerolineae bacterium]|nr:MAG: TIGR01906 family membrane protein [Anaerolineae bacterium]